MRIKIAVVFVLAFAFVSMAYAVENTQDKPAVPASHEDVRKLQGEIKRLHKETLTVAVRSKEEQQKMLDASSAAIATLKSIEHETSDNQLRTQRRIWYAAAGALFIIVTLLTVLFFFSSYRAKTPCLMHTNKNEKPDITAPEAGVSGLLVNPTQEELRAFSARYGDMKRVPMVLRILDPETTALLGEEVCDAELKPDTPPVVWFVGQLDPVSWKKRMGKAKEIILARTIA